MARDEFSLEAVIGDPDLLDKIRVTIDEARRRIDESVLNYRFVMQMLPTDTAIPSQEMITLIVAKSYAENLETWDHRDMMLPMVFAVLTVKEMNRDGGIMERP